MCKFFKISSEENLRNDFVDSEADNKDDFLWPVPKACKFLSPVETKVNTDKLVSSYYDFVHRDDLKLSRGEWWEKHSKLFQKSNFLDIKNR